MEMVGMDRQVKQAQDFPSGDRCLCPVQTRREPWCFPKSNPILLVPKTYQVNLAPVRFSHRIYLVTFGYLKNLFRFRHYVYLGRLRHWNSLVKPNQVDLGPEPNQMFSCFNPTKLQLYDGRLVQQLTIQLFRAWRCVENIWLDIWCVLKIQDWNINRCITIDETLFGKI